MYRGKHEVSRKGFGKFKRSHILLLSLLLIFSIGAGAAVAYLIDSTASVSNTFTPASVDCEVLGSPAGTTSSDVTDVKVKNSSNIDVWIRAEIVVTWQYEPEDGTARIGATPPEAGADYEMTLNTISSGSSDIAGWVLGADGYYYYTDPVSPSSTTTVLIAKCVQNKYMENNAYLCVEVIADAIQAEPTSAVVSSWSSGVHSVSADRKLIIKTSQET